MMANDISHKSHCNCTCARTPIEKTKGSISTTLENLHGLLFPGHDRAKREYLSGASVFLSGEQRADQHDTPARRKGFETMKTFWEGYERS